MRLATRPWKELSMPFTLIPTALGICFCLVWVLICGMIFRDGQIAAQQDRDSDIGVISLSARRIARSKSTALSHSMPSRHAPVRAAS
jgi:hypothetical protein